MSTRRCYVYERLARDLPDVVIIMDGAIQGNGLRETWGFNAVEVWNRLTSPYLFRVVGNERGVFERVSIVLFEETLDGAAG